MMNRKELAKAMPQLHNSWRGMRERCRNKNRADAHRYSLRGVSYSPEWDDFLEFSAWALKNGYAPGLTLDRIDGDKGYSPGNCRWVDRLVQGRNICRNVFLEHDGMRLCISEWAQRTGIPSNTLYARINKLKWKVDAALTTPVGLIPTGSKRKSDNGYRNL